MTKSFSRALSAFLLAFIMIFSLLASTSVTAYAAYDSRLPNVPSSLQNHRQLLYRDRGDCRKLVGDILVLSFYVNDGQSSWTKDQQQKVWNSQHQEIRNIENQAAQYGVTVNIDNRYLDVHIPNATIFPNGLKGNNNTDWVESVLAAAGYPSGSSLISQLKRAYQVDEAVVMFYTNTIGVSMAHMNGGSSGLEYTIMYKDSAAYQHEMFHVFGAMDEYYPPILQASALKYFGTTVMNDSSVPTTSDLTAYLLGWTNTLTQEAKNFLYATASLTNADYQAAKDSRPWNGYGEQTYDNGKYVGNFYNGIRHGEGTYYWSNGSTYTGQWDNGERTGYGTMTWSNGASYTGNFFDGDRSGYGTMRYADGGVYEGDWYNDVRSGYGTYKWSNGDRYTGAWADDARTGYGTYYWPDGSKHEGNWVNSKREGYGVHTYANGRKLKGTWVNDKKK